MGAGCLILPLLGVVSFAADMAINNDFAAYSAANEGPLTTLAIVLLLLAVGAAAAAVWFGIKGNRNATKKVVFGMVAGGIVLGLFSFWLLVMLKWVLMG